MGSGSDAQFGSACLVADELVERYLVVFRLHDRVAVYDEVFGETGGIDVDTLYTSSYFFHVVDDHTGFGNEGGGDRVCKFRLRKGCV